jgi:hypothetical protein
MIRKGIPAIAFGLSTCFPLHTADAAGELEAMLLQDYAAYNTRCRGGSGDDTATFQACGARDYVGWLLGNLGWCYGREGEAGFEMKWHRCAENSSGFRKP